MGMLCLMFIAVPLALLISAFMMLMYAQWVVLPLWITELERWLSEFKRPVVAQTAFINVQMMVEEALYDRPLVYLFSSSGRAFQSAVETLLQDGRIVVAFKTCEAEEHMKEGYVDRNDYMISRVI